MLKSHPVTYLADLDDDAINIARVCFSHASPPCCQEAEEMHIKAIQIKEQLLGHEDYEVALSVGHLASLYNYDMNQYEDAERLYLRSIAIGQSRGGGWVGCRKSKHVILCDSKRLV